MSLPPKFSPHPEDQAILAHYSTGASHSSHCGSSAGESEPVVKQASAPAGTDELISRLRTGVTKSKDVGSHLSKYQELCNEAADALARHQPSPSHPVAGLTEELRERTAFRYAGDCKCGKCQLIPRDLLDRVIDLLTSSPVSEDELARVLCEATGAPWTSLNPGRPSIADWKESGLGTQWFWRGLARSLLNQFSIGRK